jgi:hypothetical protein
MSFIRTVYISFNIQFSTLLSTALSGNGIFPVKSVRPFWSVGKPEPREWLQMAEGILYFFLYNMQAVGFAAIFLACDAQGGVLCRICVGKYDLAYKTSNCLDFPRNI